jgi:hypothetical protein
MIMPFTVCEDCGWYGLTDQDEFEKGGPFQCSDCYSLAEAKHIVSLTDDQIVEAGFKHPSRIRENAQNFIDGKFLDFNPDYDEVDTAQEKATVSDDTL